MRNDLDRSPDRGMGTGLIAGIAAAALVASLVLWAPWNDSRVADNSAPGTTVGSTTTRPAAPAAPTDPAPAAPSTTR
jgi:hypothetical protein